ncbi:hypothetical protein L6307_05140 [Candidatus Parcubacteria bacterium]|nr:hypothetical protein [Candidatus Parcubacteria bacterium]
MYFEILKLKKQKKRQLSKKWKIFILIRKSRFKNMLYLMLIKNSFQQHTCASALSAVCIKLSLNLSPILTNINNIVKGFAVIFKKIILSLISCLILNKIWFKNRMRLMKVYMLSTGGGEIVKNSYLKNIIQPL